MLVGFFRLNKSICYTSFFIFAYSYIVSIWNNEDFGEAFGCIVVESDYDSDEERSDVEN
jgi:hypothetical protein